MTANYYALLEVTPNASTTEIKRAYRRLARLHHPDLNTQAQDAHIKRLNEAYAVLIDPHKRAAYDEQRRQARLRAEAAHRQQQAQREPKMTWTEGVIGFVRELKKGMRDD
jgi:curved DNA-binding protein CbpA